MENISHQNISMVQFVLEILSKLTKLLSQTDIYPYLNQLFSAIIKILVDCAKNHDVPCSKVPSLNNDDPQKPSDVFYLERYVPMVIDLTHNVALVSSNQASKDIILKLHSNILGLMIYNHRNYVNIAPLIIVQMIELGLNPFLVLRGGINIYLVDKPNDEELNEDDEDVDNVPQIEWFPLGMCTFVLYILEHRIGYQHIPGMIAENYLVSLSLSFVKYLLQQDNSYITHNTYEFLYTLNSLNQQSTIFSSSHINNQQALDFFVELVNRLNNTEDPKDRFFGFMVMDKIISSLEIDRRFWILNEIFHSCSYPLFRSEIIHRWKDEFLKAEKKDIYSTSTITNNTNPFLSVRLVQFLIDSISGKNENIPDQLEEFIAVFNFLHLLLVKRKFNKHVSMLNPKVISRIVNVVLTPWERDAQIELEVLKQQQKSSEVPKQNLVLSVKTGITEAILTKINGLIIIIHTIQSIKEVIREIHEQLQPTTQQ
eukprot:TRINITY_DN1662_c0_g2_i2.p1 TRINITY_DN1662_c0_g2~~TRINITY_DN1662_c0_g2_i2.p1  ORF type:complete len:483 (+),score=78.37 TRINITY_DN1662_c0_g2_i2:383-1831(+)